MNLEDPYEGQKFTSFDVLKKYLEEYGKRNFVKFWIRSSHTISSLKSKSAKRMNPDLKYGCMKFACIFGGEKIRYRGSGIRKSTTYRNLGCPCMINAVVGEDGNHVKLETVVLQHNHALCKPLYDSLKKSKNKFRIVQSGKNNNQKSLLKNKFNAENVDVLINRANESNPTVKEDSVNFDLEISQLNERQEILNDHKSNLETDTTSIESDDNLQDYLKKIRKKYGNNTQIIIVKREDSDRQKIETNNENNSVFRNQNSDGTISSDEKLDDFKFSNGNKCSPDQEICRLCLSRSNKLKPIFMPSLPLESTILSFKIMSCASIEISRNDELPSNICHMCEEILDIAYNFRIKCENSDSILRKSYLSTRFMDANIISNVCAYQDEIDDKIKFQKCFKQRSAEIIDVSCCDFTEHDGNDIFGIEDVVPDPNSDVCKKFDGTCPICGNVSHNLRGMLQHMKDHRHIENFLLTCNFCSLLFTTVASLLEHMNGHVIDGNGNGTGQLFPGSQCNMSFVTTEDAKLHQEAYIVKDERSSDCEISMGKASNSTGGYLCNVCGKILKSKDRFQSHRNMHEGLRPHICLKCGRGFADRKNMHQHFDIVHLRKAKHECPICHKKFYAPTKMKSHITMHYGVKPFSCDVCHRTFRLRMNMIKHKKTHSNERPHKCDKCNAAFIDKNLLTRHSYVHGGIRPYVCPFCGHRFTVRFNLKKHMVSGKCSGRNKVKEMQSEIVDGEWITMSTSQSKTNLHEMNEL